MNGVEPLQRERHGVGLNELEGESRLWLDVHTHNLEACAVIPQRRPASAAEQIKKPWLHA